MNAIVDVAGWTLVHFVWQGTLAALVAAVALRLLRHGSAQARYAIACAALAAMLIAPLVTIRLVSRQAMLVPATAAAVDDQWLANRATLATAAVEPRASERGGRGSAASFPAPLDPADVRAVLPTLVTLWLAGVGALLVRLAGGWWRVRRLHRRSRACVASRWHASGSRLATRLGLRRHVHIVDSPDVDTPLVIGSLRPVILRPNA